MKTVAKAFLEIISREVTGFKVRSRAFVSGTESAFFTWHDWISDISGMGIICFGCGKKTRTC